MNNQPKRKMIADKKILLIVLILFLFYPLFISAQHSGIEIYSEDGDVFFLLINKAPCNDTAANKVSVSPLIPSVYQIHIRFADTLLGELVRDVVLKKNTLNIYAIKALKVSEIQQQVKKTGEALRKLLSEKDDTSYQKTMDQRFTIRLISQKSLEISANDSLADNEERVAADLEKKRNIPQKFITEKDTLIAAETITIQFGESETDSVFVEELQNDTMQSNDERPCEPFTDADFNSLCQLVGKEVFEDDKLKCATNAVAYNSLSIDQLRRLLLLLDFENSKIVLIKSAWSNVSDKENVASLYDVFEFQSNVDTVKAWISQQNSN